MSYTPPGWTAQHVANATADELLRLDYSVRSLSFHNAHLLLVSLLTFLLDTTSDRTERCLLSRGPRCIARRTHR